MNRREAIAALMSLPATATITQATVEPSDSIILECEGHMSSETAERIRKHIEQIWPGRKVVVLCDGLKIRIAKNI